MALLSGVFLLWFMFVLALVVVPFALWVIALVELLRAPDVAFGPPWENAKNAWLIGFVVGLIVPAGILVLPILWWYQGHKALRAGQRVPRPFWWPAPSHGYRYPPPPPVPATPQDDVSRDPMAR